MTETVEEMVMSVEAVLDDRELSKQVVRQILKDFGGMQVYLPRPESAFRKDDYAAINEAFDGTNARELCREYNITFNTLYKIIRQERDRKKEDLAKKAARELPFED